MPVDRPVVPRAEATSKAESINGRCGPTTNARMKVPQTKHRANREKRMAAL
jgi:hypothetical protein